MKGNLTGLLGLGAAGAMAVGLFAVSAVCGFSVGQADGISARRHSREQSYLLDRMAKSLDLTSEQTARIQPIIEEIRIQIFDVHIEEVKKKQRLIDLALSEIGPILSTEQQKKLDALQKARQELNTAKEKLRSL